MSEIIAPVLNYRSLDSWQDETNADKFGNVDAIATIYSRTGLEHLTFPIGENLTGEAYNDAIFLQIEPEILKQYGLDDTDYQKSFPLSEAVKSTGK